MKKSSQTYRKPELFVAKADYGAYTIDMKIHFVGICGASMHALSQFAAARGNSVTGSDEQLDGHDPKNVDGADLVVYTSAIPQTNCELVRARELGVPTIERAEYLGRLSHTYDNVIAVGGCHGKSTATAMLGCIFGGATVHVGVAGASRAGSRKLFITEACEYRESFLSLSPDLSIVLNIQYDHPDYYGSFDELVSAYKRFCRRSSRSLVNGDDPACAALCSDYSFGRGAANDFTVENIHTENVKTCFDFCYPAYGCNGKKKRKRVETVAGEHNALNAAAALAAAKICGADMDECIKRLSAFNGLPRRFERLGNAFGKAVYTDYAHHPTEIAATIQTARELHGSVAVVFQPHTFSRTKALEEGFAGALATADAVVFAPVFAARETPIAGVSSHSICRRLVELGKTAYCFDTFAEINEYCENLPQNCIVYTGAGNINIAAQQFIKNDALIYD